MSEWGRAANFVAVLRRSTGLFPFLVVNVVTGLGMGVVPFVPLGLQIMVVGIFVLSIFSTLFCCFYFLVKDPNRLGSETQMIQNKALDLLADESHRFGTRAAHILAIVNPNNTFADSDEIEPPPEDGLSLTKQLPPQ